MLTAVCHGNAMKVAMMLMGNNPGFDVNMEQDEYRLSLMHHACVGGNRTAVIPFLLAHPDIDVNVKTRYGDTPFSTACANGYASCAREMLQDSRVRVNDPNNRGWTPLWCAASRGHLEVIQWWIASGREMDLWKPGDVEITEAQKRRKGEVATLQERFKNDAAQTRHATRVDLGLLDELAAEMFVLVVFVSDGLLRIPAPFDNNDCNHL